MIFFEVENQEWDLTCDGFQDQSGRYHCIPTNTPQASVLVHVLDGESLEDEGFDVISVYMTPP